MKTYTLEVLRPESEALVADLLAALHRQHLIRYIEAPTADNPLLLTAEEIEADVLLARQQPGLSREAVRTRLGL